MSKKRAMITVDSDQWERLQAILKEQGFAPGAMSDYIGFCLEELEANLKGEEPCGYSPYLELLIQRNGLRRALRDTGFRVVKESEEELDLP